MEDKLEIHERLNDHVDSDEIQMIHKWKMPLYWGPDIIAWL